MRVAHLKLLETPLHHVPAHSGKEEMMDKRTRRLVTNLCALLVALLALTYSGEANATMVCENTGSCQGSCTGDCSVYGDCNRQCDYEACTSGVWVECEDWA